MAFRILACLCCALLLPLSARAQDAAPAQQAQARQLWQLLDYVAVDYGGAVSAGVVAHEAEYAEMQEFVADAAAHAEALPAGPSKAALIQAIGRLREAVQRKAEAGEVARLAHAANALLLAAYPIPVAPKVLPDLRRGAALYEMHCAACHGPGGAGDGPRAAGLQPPPIAFSDPARARSRSLLSLYQITAQGVAGTAMPSFAATLSEADLWALAFHTGTLAHDESLRRRGAEAWRQDAALRARFASLSALTTATEDALSETMPAETARGLLAYLRSHPEAVSAVSQARGLDLARSRLSESLIAARRGDTAAALRLGLSAYLDGFEPLEPVLGARNKPLLAEVEAAMMAYRNAVGEGRLDAAEAAAQRLDRLFAQVGTEMDAGPADATTTFVAALTILLREGVEALLIVIGMVAFLRKAQRSDVMRHVHAGWLSALLAGGLTWAVATYVVGISGTSREVTEGLSSLFAAAVLLSVGLWMHQKSAAGRWQEYLSGKLASALSRGSAPWALFGLAFIAVYREVFETVLFFSALWSEGQARPLLAGLAVGAALLAVLAGVLLRSSARMPIGKFFAVSSVLVAVLAVVLAGKGVAGLQEAGWLPVSPFPWPHIDALGMYPFAETTLAQLLVLFIALLGFGLNVLSGRRPRAG